ncbi:MAG: NYN domain-containing protein [Candidatus Eisenbacteria bacterium]
MRQTIIDGHNFILTVESLAERLAYEGKRASREEAEDLVLEWAKRSGEVSASIIYDGQKFPGGHPGNRDEGPLRVRFTDPPAEADDLIAFEAKEAVGRGDEVTVVTADKDLAKKAKRAGAKIISTEHFYYDVNRPPPQSTKEEHFTAKQMAELEETLLTREEEEPESPEVSEVGAEGAEEAPPRAVEGRRAPALAPEAKAVHARPDREGRKARYLEKMKRRAARGPAPPPKSKKKRRGF